MRNACDESSLVSEKPLGKLERAIVVMETISQGMDLLMKLGDAGVKVTDTPGWARLKLKMWYASPRALAKRVYDLKGRQQQDERNMMTPENRQDAVRHILTKAHNIAEEVVASTTQEFESSGSANSSSSSSGDDMDKDDSNNEETVEGGNTVNTK
jgi:hypothetical protein